MSAIAVCRRETAIVIAFDSIAYGADGVVSSVRAGKVMPIPELGMVIGNTGIGNFTSFLRAQMAHQYASFDEAIVGAPTDFEMTRIFMIAMGKAIEEQPCTVIYAGWSDDRSRFETYRISARDKEIMSGDQVETIAANTLHPIPGDWCSARYRREDAAKFGLDRGEESSALEEAVGLVCAARATTAHNHDAIGDDYAVGGDLHVIILERETMTQMRTHRWPDVVGRRIDPDAGEAMPEWLADRIAP